MAKFQISPNMQFGIGLGVTLLAVFSKGSVAMPMGIPPIVGQYIDSWANFLLFLYAPVATFMAAYASSQPGFAAPPDPQIVIDATKKAAAAVKAASGVVGALLVGLLFAAALAIVAPQARAASSSATPNVSGPLIIDPLHLNSAAASAAAKDDDSGAGGPLSDLASLFASDFASAATLATATSIKDGNGQACWTAFGPFGELVKAHPHVFSGKLATDLEAQRLLVMNARKLCDNVACQTVFTEAATAVSKVTSALPVSVNVNVTPINLFAKACADVPNIAVVAPSAEPASAASPTPAPTAQ